MKKNAELLICLQLSVTFSSHATYTLKKLPTTKLVNRYRVIYKIKNSDPSLKEEGILEEKITPLNWVCYDDPAYKLDYKYQKIFNLDLDNHSYSFQNQLLVDENLKVLSYDRCHPIIFYLHNIRMGLATEFLKEGEHWCVEIPNNKHTYIDKPDVVRKSSHLKTVCLQYVVNKIDDPNILLPNNSYLLTEDLEDFEYMNSDSLPIKYTISWNALSLMRHPSRRCGRIIIDSEGVLQSLKVNLPKQLKGFSLVDYQDLNQFITLKIQRIHK